MVKVSIVMITYNHELYIKEAILGVLAQDTEFDFELIVADDFSDDKTEFVVNEIISTHSKSNAIKYTRHASNKGMILNFIWALEQCNGEYIALCEGDDYWTDPLKLQKQVDFLEGNRDYVMCFHPVKVLEHDGRLVVDYLTNVPDNFETLETLVKKGNYIHTPSVVFRNRLTEIPDVFRYSPIGDYILYILLAKNGLIGLINEEMAVYRIGSGIWSSLDIKSKSFKNFKSLLIINDILNSYNIQLSEIMKFKIRQNHIKTLSLLSYKEINELRLNDSISLFIDQLLYELIFSYEQFSYKRFSTKKIIKHLIERVSLYKLYMRIKWFR